MNRIIPALALAGLSTVAMAGPPVVSVNIENLPLPVEVVSTDVVPLADIGPHIRSLCDAGAGQCELLVPHEGAIALYEVHFSPLPADPAPEGVQCWVRVRLRQDTVALTEIAKFVWPANDLRGLIHGLAFPVGLEGNLNTVLSLNVGSSGGIAACPIEVKIYTRQN
jgi:hypothetical protein